MIKLATLAILAIATTFTIHLSQLPPKPYYHTLYLSPYLSSNTSISHHLYTLTRRPHVAGTQANEETATYVLTTLSSYSIKSHLTSYDVLLTYPISRSLTLMRPPPQPSIKFALEQEIYEGDPNADSAREVLPTFHAYAKLGSVSGQVVYVNYGRVEDYETLRNMGVSVTGHVVLARYGKIYRGDIVENAYEAGAIGVVIFTDRKDYGGGGGGVRWFPDDKWMPPSGVQVGTLYRGAGDPTTPGWASLRGCERLNEEEVEMGGDVPLIPSLPVCGEDGETILRSIGGQVADDDWQGSVDAPVYKVGPGPGILNLTYFGESRIATIQNVIGVIEGVEEPDRFVILGNHRDAWTYGAADPNSGTAVLLDVADRLAKLQKRGWKPRRTIVFCNWDAEEYGLIGSTEWVEENRELLASRAVAYLNVDVAVSGPGFSAASTPQLDELLKQATQQVQDPDNSSQSIYDSWVGPNASPHIDRLGGGGSDYAAFVQHVGIPSLDLSYGGGYPVYHSLYDDFVWMEKYGDPMFRRHVAVASFLGLVALRLADEEILPFDYLPYASELQENAKTVETSVAKAGIDLIPLFESIKDFTKAAEEMNIEREAIKQSKSWSPLGKEYSVKVRQLNDRLMMAERAFTDRDGLLSRSWYKHLIFAPSTHDDYGSKCFPGIDDAIEKTKQLNTAESWKYVQHEVWRVARATRQASFVLRGKLT